MERNYLFYINGLIIPTSPAWAVESDASHKIRVPPEYGAGNLVC